MRTVAILLLILIVVLVLSLIITLGVIGVGWIAIQVFPALSHFEASLIALIASACLFLVGYRFLTFANFGLGPWYEDDWYEDEDEWEPPSKSQAKRKSDSQASSKKRRR